MLPRHLVRIVNPNGGVVYKRIVEEQFSNDQLLERILLTENIGLAWKRVRANKGAPGIDGITIEEFLSLFVNAGRKLVQPYLKGFTFLLLFKELTYLNRTAVLVHSVFRLCWIELFSRPSLRLWGNIRSLVFRIELRFQATAVSS